MASRDLLLRLVETFAWWELESPILLSGDGSVQRLSRLVVDEAYAADHAEQAALEVAIARAEMLLQSGWHRPAEFVQAPGRFLLLLTELNLMDGSAALASPGIFGELNIPACDLWIEFVPEVRSLRGDVQPALWCWIPACLVHVAQRGVDVNPEGCLVWADEHSPQFLEDRDLT